MDLVFILFTILNDVFGILCCRSTNVEEFSGFFQWLGMSNMDVKGYRRLRTLSQLTFESLPQLFTMLIFISFYSEEAKERGVTMSEIYISLVFAIAHMVTEASLLYIEAKAVKQDQ